MVPRAGPAPDSSTSAVCFHLSLHAVVCFSYVDSDILAEHGGWRWRQRQRKRGGWEGEGRIGRGRGERKRQKERDLNVREITSREHILYFLIKTKHI